MFNTRMQSHMHTGSEYTQRTLDPWLIQWNVFIYLYNIYIYMYICYYPTCSFHDSHLNGTNRCTRMSSLICLHAVYVWSFCVLYTAAYIYIYLPHLVFFSFSLFLHINVIPFRITKPRWRVQSKLMEIVARTIRIWFPNEFHEFTSQSHRVLSFDLCHSIAPKLI